MNAEQSYVADPRLAESMAYGEQPYREARLHQIANAAGAAVFEAEASGVEVVPVPRTKTLEEFLENPADIREGDSITGLTLARQLDTVQDSIVSSLLARSENPAAVEIRTRTKYPARPLSERLRSNLANLRATYDGKLNDLQVTFLRPETFKDPQENPPRHGEALTNQLVMVATARTHSTNPRLSNANLRAGTRLNLNLDTQKLDVVPVSLRDSKSDAGSRVGEQQSGSSVRAATIERRNRVRPFGGGGAGLDKK